MLDVGPVLLAPLHPFVSQSNKFWSYRTWLYGVRDRAPLTREINKTLIYVKWAYDTSLSLFVGTRANIFWENCKITIRAMFFFFFFFLVFSSSSFHLAICWLLNELNNIISQLNITGIISIGIVKSSVTMCFVQYSLGCWALEFFISCMRSPGGGTIISYASRSESIAHMPFDRSTKKRKVELC